MSGAVAQVLDGITMALADGTKVRCRPPSVRNARLLIQDYRRVSAAPPAPLAGDATREQVAAHAAALQQDEDERQAAMTRLLDLFPAAVGLPDEVLDRLTPGDILNVLPGFFWKGTGAQVVVAASGSPTGTPSGTDSGATTGRPSA